MGLFSSPSPSPPKPRPVVAPVVAEPEEKTPGKKKRKAGGTRNRTVAGAALGRITDQNNLLRRTLGG